MYRFFYYLGLFLTSVSFAQQPIFSITPLVPAPNTLINTEMGTAIFQITNNTNVNLPNISIVRLPPGVSNVSSNVGVSYCSDPINLASGAHCLLKLRIDSSALTAPLIGGPILCYTAQHPLFCSQPLRVDQLATQVLQQSVSTSCAENISNFLYTLTQPFDSTATPDPTWGPYSHTFTYSPSNPDLRDCPNTAGVSWRQQRVLAAADYWISKKLNYCHHHVPDWPTPLSGQGAAFNEGGYCSPFVDLMPGTVYYNQQARWNYSGTGSETISNWQNNNMMWYGFDCSNYTEFLYKFALGIAFTGETGWQAGQAEDGSQIFLSPNQQTPGNVLENPNAAGKLVCADNTLKLIIPVQAMVIIYR